MSLDRFYPIFDHVDWLERLVPLGIKLVQLRIKDRSDTDIKAQIRRAKKICAAQDCTLIINDYWKIALDEGCAYVHLGQEDLDHADIAAIRTGGMALGLSTHDKAELARALALSPDYIALGPIYPTILKKMKWHEQGIDRLSTWRGLMGNTPLVAIGGMSIARAQGAFDAGADCVAAVTDITLNASPEDRVREWLAATR
ncbi:thiamine-phosphate synthase [Amylibacter marinus]|uniref:Thiamine-phosphate synthase n=1 Tax=Amylibacter marinus TaxID=1475483 RepID=A0ABQ5VSA6_9RHOB|nr:thiamine phosphate synthase [Amylibacter marinus]GLQ34180.1 thiamine-phosphate synthase [Amylibacter marinus]